MMSQRTNHLRLAFVCCAFTVLSLNEVCSFQQSFPVKRFPNGRGFSDLNRSPLKFTEDKSRKVIQGTSMNLFSKQSTVESKERSLSARLLKMKTFMFKILNFFQPKSVKQWLLMTTISLACLFSSPAVARTSGGRIGGTYSRPSRPSMSRPAVPSRPHRRPLPPKKHYHYPNTYPRYRTSSPQFHAPVGYSTTTIVQSPYMREIHPRKIGVGDLVLWTGVGLAVSTGVRRHYEQQHGSRSLDDYSPLGPGATAAFLTVAFQVPNRTSSSSLLKILESKAMSSNTNTRQGLQQVVSEVSLELLRKDSAILSVGTSIKHFGSVRDAQVAFQKASIMNRSKLDRESVSNVGGSKIIQREEEGNDDNFFKPLSTLAVVTLGLCIEGNSLSIRIPKQLRNRKDLRNALSQIASDVQTEDCLLSAEILWTPEEEKDFLSERDVYADYPDLYPLLD